MKRLILVLALAGAAVWAAVAVATTGQGQTNTIMSLGTLQGDVAYNTGIKADPASLTWQGKQYAADKLPEFLMRLRSAGVTDLGAWLNLHPAVSAKFGMAPVGLLHSPEIVTQPARFAPGAVSGWHSHPGFLVSTVVSGQLTRYGTDCSSETFGRASRSTRPVRARSSSRTRPTRRRWTPSPSSSREARRRPGFGSTSRSPRPAANDPTRRICERPSGARSRRSACGGGRCGRPGGNDRPGGRRPPK